MLKTFKRPPMRYPEQQRVKDCREGVLKVFDELIEEVKARMKV